MKQIKRMLSLLLAFVMLVGMIPTHVHAAEADATLTASLQKAKNYIDGITINNSSNEPNTVVKNFKTHFTWDNEKRENSKSYLFDWSYYNGVVFQGFVENVPTGVLSGGQYDNLMKKRGRKSGAIGFAVYLDTLERLNLTAKKFDVDCVLLYDESTSASDLANSALAGKADASDLADAVNALVAEEKTVMAQRIVPENIKYRQLLKLNGKEVDVLENND